MNTREQSGYALINSLNLYYEWHGTEGEILVLVHGGGSTIDSTFGRIIPRLESEYRLLALELQAHGRSGDREGPETFEQDADDVAALLHYLKISSAHFLGFSNGGTTVLQIAIRHPRLVKRMVLVSALTKRNGMIPGFFEGMPTATLDQMPEPLKHAYCKVAEDKNKLIVMFEKDRNRMIDFTDIPDSSLQRIDRPCLVMVSDKDVVTVEHSLLLANTLAAGRLVVMPGAHGEFLGEICCVPFKESLITSGLLLIESFLKKELD